MVKKPCANMKRSCKLKAVISLIFPSRMCSNQRVLPNKEKPLQKPRQISHWDIMCWYYIAWNWTFTSCQLLHWLRPNRMRRGCRKLRFLSLVLGSVIHQRNFYFTWKYCFFAEFFIELLVITIILHIKWLLSFNCDIILIF